MHPKEEQFCLSVLSALIIEFTETNIFTVTVTAVNILKVYVYDEWS